MHNDPLHAVLGTHLVGLELGVGEGLGLGVGLGLGNPVAILNEGGNNLAGSRN